MCVAAHPDDEDGATLTVLRRKYGVHTVTVFSTYGEGGQNATGPELYEELGAIRARETLAAAEIQGSEAWFLALRDFGFSKSAEEAFRIWGHDEALRRLVLKIRNLRPDVIITNHDTSSGHGHHQATGRLVIEAFDAAADPQRFPEQLRTPSVTIWQAQRLFVRVNYENGTGSRALEEAAERAGKVIVVNPNERDAARGTTYAEQALQALHQHASQGPWPDSVPKGGAPLIRYRLAREAARAVALPAGAHDFTEGLRLPPALAARLAPPTIEGRSLVDFANEPERVFDALVAARKSRQTLRSPENINGEPHYVLIDERLQRALAAASGITATLVTRDQPLFPNAPAVFTLTFNNKGTRTAWVNFRLFFDWEGGEQSLYTPLQLAPNQTLSTTITARRTPTEANINVPHAAHLYDGRLFGNQVTALSDVVIGGENFMTQVWARIDIAPAVEIERVEPSPFILTPARLKQRSTFTLHVVNHQSQPFAGRLNSESSIQKSQTPGGVFKLAGNEARDVSRTMDGLSNLVSLYHGNKRSTGGFVSFSVTQADSSATLSKQIVPIVWADARVPDGLRVGYVRSFDETLRKALDALGVKAKELSIEDVRAGDLKSYDTIIIDNRGYQAHPELVRLNGRLLDYTRAGGTLIVFYHKTGEWNPDPKQKRTQLAPYPITLGTQRVTDEAAPITLMEAGSALLNFPNQIERADFDGWIQERGLYYPKEWDAHYSAPLSTNDAGEAPLNGGLLAADYGRGRYIYTSMVWYRQLRAGIPGAYRLFANMISYGHAAGATRNTTRFQ